MHEHPYLNGANSEKLQKGHVVTNEPVSVLATVQSHLPGPAST